MKYLLLLAVISCVAVAEWQYDGDVLVLTDKNFDDAIKEFEYIMVEFYAPWCGHCKEFAPKYAEAATALKPEGIVLAKFDAHEHNEFAKKYDVKGYPTVKFAVKGVFKPYEGPRTVDGVKNFIYQNLNPESELLESVEAVQKAVQENAVQFIYFAEETNEKDRELRKYKEFSFTMKQHFAHTQSKTIREALNIPSGTYLVGFRNGQRHFYEGKLQVPIMKIFVENVANERLLDYSDRPEFVDDRLFTSNKPVVIVYTDHDALLAVARQYPFQEDLVFVKNLSEATSKKLNIRPQDQTGVFIVKGEQKYRKPASQPLGEFLGAFKENKAAKYLKSSPPPKESGPIRVLVGDTYESVFSGDDTVVLYYDSTNPEHAQVEQEFAGIQKRLEQNKQLKWAKMDLSQNEASDMTESIQVVKLRLYKGSAQFAKFVIRANKIQEERFVKWIVENASQRVVDPKAEL